MTDTINEQPDWEINPDDYLKDADGKFILKVDGTPKKNRGVHKALKAEAITSIQKQKQNKEQKKN
jgi:hypothetical protein